MPNHRNTIRRRSRPLVGWLWHLASAAAAALLLATWSAKMPALGGPAVLAFFLVPILLYRQGHRHFIATARQVEADDPRPPILYLRSFRHDRALREHEEALARIMAGFGPFVAIGDPSDPLPPLAAARDYVPDSDWQASVLDRMSRSRLVIVLAGNTPGLAWEVEQCRQRLDPTRLIIVVQSDRADYDSFRAAVAERGVHLPPHCAFGQGRGPLAGIVTFDAMWRASAHPFARIVLLDPTSLFQAEEASWRHTLAAVKPAGIDPELSPGGPRFTAHWRAVPLAVAAVLGARALRPLLVLP